MLGGGVWLIVVRGSYADLCSDNEWFEAVVCMLAVGSLLLIFCILSFVAMCYKNSQLLMLVSNIIILSNVNFEWKHVPPYLDLTSTYLLFFCLF